MARKQTRGTQISRIALAAFFAASLLAAPLWAQTGKAAPARKGAEQKNAPAQKTAPQKTPQKTQQKTAPQKNEGPSVADIDKDIGQTRGALDSVKAELERGRGRFRELQNEEGNYLSRLEQLEKNISASGRFMELVQGQIDTTEKTLALLGDSLAAAEGDLHNAREQMKRRLRAAQMTGEAGRLQTLLSARSPAEFIHRVRYFQDLNRYDRRLAETIRKNILTVSEKRASQEANKAALGKLLDEKRHEQRAFVQEEASRRATLEDIRTKKDAFAAMVAEFEETQRELDAIIAVLEERRRRAIEEEEERKKRQEKVDEERRAITTFERRRGRLSWPVRGEVVTKYGRVEHPVYKTVIMNNGIDIAAKKGTPVKSVAPGSVAHLGSMRGLGRFVILDHNGGFMTIYGNLDEIRVALNQDIAIGAEIGTVGETGTAGGPKLHFEIRKSAETLDPEEWLER